MARYQDLGDGLYALETPIGRAVIRSDEGTLQQAGHQPDDSEGFANDYAAQGQPDDSAGFQSAYEQEQANPSPERPLEQPAYAAPPGADPGPLSQAFGGAEAKGGPGFSSAGARTDAELAAQGMPQPAAPPPPPPGLPKAGPGDKFSSANAQPPPPRQGVTVDAQGKPAPSDVVMVGGPGGAPPPAESPPAGMSEGGKDLVAQAIAEAKRGSGYSPGGMQLASRKVEGQKLPAGILAGMQREPDYSGARAADVPIMRANLRDANMMREEWQRQEAELADYKQRYETEAKPEIERRTNEAQRAWQEAEKVGKNFNYDRVWQNKTTWGKILATSMIILSRIMGAKTGVSFADQAYNAAVRDDIDEQKAVYDAAMNKGKTADNAYARALKFYGTPEQAEADIRIRSRIVLQGKVMESALHTQNANIIKATEQWIAGDRAALNVERAKVLQGIAPKVTEEWKMRQASGGGGGLMRQLEAGAKATGLINLIEGRPKEPKPGGHTTGEQRGVEWAMKTRINNLPGGITGYAPPEEAAKVRKMMAQKKALDYGIKRVSSLAQEYKQGKISGAAYLSRLGTVSSGLAVAFKEASGLGAWDSGVERLWRNVTGVPAGGVVGAIAHPIDTAIGVSQAGGQLSEFQKQSNVLQDETLRSTVSLDPQGTQPFYGLTPEE